MRSFIFLLLSLFSMLYHPSQAQELRLSVNEIFSPEKEAHINISTGYYYYGDDFKETSPEKFTLNLYKPADQENTLINILANKQEIAINDSILLKSELIKTWEATLENDDWGESSISLGKLPVGIFIVEALYQSQVARIPILVSEYALISKKKGDEIIGFVADVTTGKQAPNFDLFIIEDGELKPANQSINGISTFKINQNNSGRNSFKLIAKYQDQLTASDFYYYSYSEEDGPIGLIFTDRPAYRPNQQVYFQGYFRNVKGYAMEAHSDSIYLKIFDGNDNEVYSKKVNCDANGSFTDSLNLKENATLGTYTIYASLNEREAFGYYYQEITGSFRVEEYKKPEYEVTISLNKPQYISGDTIIANIQADYFFGAPVKNAEVSYRIVRELYYVSWYASYAYSWWYEDWYYPNSYGNSEVIERNIEQLDENGQLQIKFATDGETNKNYRYKILADVTDASRRSIAGSATALTTATAFTITVNAEKFYYKTDEEIVVRINASDFTNSPIETDFELLLRPYRYDTDEVPSPTSKQIGKTSKEGVSIIKLPIDEPGYYQIEVTAIDKNSKKVSGNNSVYVLEEGQNAYSWWDNESAEIQLFTDKKIYQAGDTLNAMILAPKASDALITLDGKAIVHKNIVGFNTSGEESFQEYQIPLLNNIYGDLQLGIAYVRDGVSYTRNEKITVIPADKYLNVTITFDEESYQPRNTAEAKIKVTDATNQPVSNAQVALSTADESIYFLYPDKTTDIRKSFYPNQNSQTYTYFSNYSQDQRGDWPNYDYLKSLLENGTFKPSYEFFVPNGRTHYFKLGNYDKSQKISGYVVDEATGKLLKGVKIQSGKVKAKTDEWGYYELTNPSDTLLSFSYKGHKITFTDAYFFKETVSGLRQARLNVKLNSSKKEKVNLNLNNPSQYTPRNSELLMADSFAADGGADDWGSAEEEFSPTVMATAQRKSTTARREEVQPVIRQNFKDAIYWNTNITTDANGEATVKITLPDNLTTWRTTARVITKDTKVGQTFAKTVVTKDLLLRMETPRFFRTGDELLIATTVHNYLKNRKRVRVNLKANGITVKGTNKYITIPANGEAKVDWEVKANWPGDAIITAEAVTNEESDAKKVTVPVQANGLEVITAESAVLQSETQATIEIEIPEEVDLNTVQLELSNSPSVAASLLGSLDQLIGYPYGCVEQTMSRFLPTLIVANTLQELGQDYTSTISEAELQKMTDKGLARLAELQHTDGGWGWWENDNTHPFMTAYVVNGLSLAKETGYAIPDVLLSNGKESLKNMLLSDNLSDTTTYAYQVAAAMQANISDIWENVNKPAVTHLDAYQTALWLQAAQLAKDENAVSTYLARLESIVNKDGLLNYWGGKKFYYSWQDDRVETTAQVVKALSEENIQHPLLSGAIQWLMQKRRGNSWHNTRQTAFTVLGLQKVIRSEINPDYEVYIQANGRKVYDGKVNSSNVFQKATSISLRSENFTASKKSTYQSPAGVLKHGKNTITINKQGDGTLYSNAKLTYFLQKSSKSIQKLKNKGITVERKYFSLKPIFDEDGKVIYTKTPINDTKTVSGTDVFVKVKINSKEDLEYVLIEDPIPAGFEFIRDKTGYLIEGEEAYSGGNYYRSYFRWMNQAHTEYRDNRYAIVLTKLNKGEYEYSYLVKAQIPGTYEVNPTLVQLMYYPEKRGFSDFETIKIEEKE